MTKSFLNTSNVRAIKNNNPLNIRRGSSPWIGKIPFDQSKDSVFEQFSTWVFGIRAGIKNLHTIYDETNHTVSAIISKWAPASDGNKTASYITLVANRMNVGEDTPFLWTQDNIKNMVQAMATVESGEDCIEDTDFTAAWFIS